MIENALIASLIFGFASQSIPSTQLRQEQIDIEIDINSVNEDYRFLAQEVPVVEEKGFAFQLQGCSITAGASAPFRCDFLVQNRQRLERKLSIYANASRRSYSRVFDFRGNEILASQVQLGSSSSARAAEVLMPAEIPVRLTILFETVPEEGPSLIDLGAYLYGNGGGSFRVKFELTR